MKETSFSWELFQQCPIVGIVRNMAFDDLEAVLPVYVKAGLTTIEITMNTPGAAKMIGYAVEHYSGQLNIGAGTVCTKADLKAALAAGAAFIVTPILSKKVVAKCVEKQVPVFPGAYTPTEIYKAIKWGATMVKIFPATTLGPAYIKEVKAPLNQAKLLPTGGVNLENIPAFLKAGADGLGIGSHLFDQEMIKNKDWEKLEKHFKAFVALIQSPYKNS